MSTSWYDIVTVVADHNGPFTMIQTQATTCPLALVRVVITVSVENDLVVVNGGVTLHTDDLCVDEEPL